MLINTSHHEDDNDEGTDDGRDDVALKGLPSEVVGVGVQ